MTMHTTDFPKEGDTPVLQFVTGFTCNDCGSTDVKETGIRKTKFGKWLVTKCNDCDVVIMYKTE